MDRRTEVPFFDSQCINNSEKSAEKAKKGIAVLSQYKAQVSALETKLKKEGLEQCTVCTVVASQG